MAHTSQDYVETHNELVKYKSAYKILINYAQKHRDEYVSIYDYDDLVAKLLKKGLNLRPVAKKSMSVWLKQRGINYEKHPDGSITKWVEVT